MNVLTDAPVSSLGLIFHLFVAFMMMKEYKKWPELRMYKYLQETTTWPKRIFKLANHSLATLLAGTIIIDPIFLIFFGNQSKIGFVVKYFLLVELLICGVIALSFKTVAIRAKKLNPIISHLANSFAISECFLIIAIIALGLIMLFGVPSIR
jgi:hypothetical protein